MLCGTVPVSVLYTYGVLCQVIRSFGRYQCERLYHEERQSHACIFKEFFMSIYKGILKAF
jgi:hypothetical protein